MEKRALIAFILSLAVLLGWELFTGSYRTPPPQAPQQQEQTSPAPAPTTPPSPAPGQPLPGPVSPQALPQDRLTTSPQSLENWNVEASLYKMQIVSPGARINSFLLKKFREEVNPDSPPMEMVPTQASGYLPFAVDLLQHPDWQFSTRPFSSSAPSVLPLPADSRPQTLAYQAEVPGQVRVTKTFTFIPDSYAIDTEIHIQNLSETPLNDQLGVSFYFRPYAGSVQESSYNLSHIAFLEKGALTNYQLKDLEKKEVIMKAPMDWVGYENNYFLQAIIPEDASGFQVVPRVLDATTGLVQMVYLTDPLQVDPNQEKIVKMRLYIGPKELNQLDKAGHQLSRSVDYGWFTFLAKPLLHVLTWLYAYVHNYGIAIILLTVLIKLIFWPLTQKSYKSMQTMKKIQPKIAQIREKYKDDREKLNQELMGVYKTYKVNPLGGCLPMVLQIPVFFALYRMLYGAVQLRHQPFFLWINDLTAPDRLQIGVPIPYLGGIPVLTILMGISMFIQQKMTPSGGDPRQEQMMLLMPVIFTVFFINFPSGLVLYWLVNNILSIVQQYWINRNA